MIISNYSMLHLACFNLHRKTLSPVLGWCFGLSDMGVFEGFLLFFCEEEKDIIKHAYSELFAYRIFAEDASLCPNIAEGD